MKRMQQRDSDSEGDRDADRDRSRSSSQESTAPASKRERTSTSPPTAAAQTRSSASASTSNASTVSNSRDRDERERERLRPFRSRYRDRRSQDYYRDFHYWHYYNDSDSDTEGDLDKSKRLCDQMVIKSSKLNNNQVYKAELQHMPSRLLLVASLPQVIPDVAVSHGWSSTDHSVNVYVREDDPFTFHRQPIAQSTDSIRTKQGYSRGIHVFQIWWSRRQRGTHAVVGVGTKDADVHCVGYQALIGANRESWGWDIGRLRLVHDSQRTASGATGLPQNDSRPARDRDRDRSRTAHDSPSNSDTSDSTETNGNGSSSRPDHAVHNKAYPACWTGGSSIASDTAVVPERFFMVLDCDEGTLSFVANDQFLGVAFRGLRGRTLYPMISAVWGHGEVTMRYYNGIDEPLPLRDLCRYTLRQHFGTEHLSLMEHLPLPKPIIDYLLYRTPNAVSSSSSKPPRSPLPCVGEDSNSSSI